jgi:hypothetical protein
MAMMSGSSFGTSAQAPPIQSGVQGCQHVAQRIVAQDAFFVAVEASEERQMLRPPQRRLDEVVCPGERRGQHQKQDFREWIQYLGMLTRIGKGGEVIQQGDAGRGRPRQASIDEAPYETNFQPRRKLPPPFKRLPWADFRPCFTAPVWNYILVLIGRITVASRADGARCLASRALH